MTWWLCRFSGSFWGITQPVKLSVWGATKPLSSGLTFCEIWEVKSACSFDRLWKLPQNLMQMKTRRSWTTLRGWAELVGNHTSQVEPACSAGSTREAESRMTMMYQRQSADQPTRPAHISRSSDGTAASVHIFVIKQSIRNRYISYLTFLSSSFAICNLNEIEKNQ